jgi:hypothetical protein
MSEITRDTLLAVLRDHIGKAKGITARALVEKLLDGAPRSEFAGAERHLRDLVVVLRNEGHHVCAHPSTGYYLAETPEELDETCAFLQHRALCSLSQVSAMKRVSIPDLVGQLKLPT